MGLLIKGGWVQMPVPDPRCDRTERFRCRWYIVSLTGLSGFPVLVEVPVMMLSLVAFANRTRSLFPIAQ